MLREIRQLDPEVIDGMFKLTYGSDNMYTSLDTINEIENNFSSWLVTIPTGITENAAAFSAVWVHYRNTTLEQLHRGWEGLMAEYDPVSNYYMLEQSSDGRKLSKETDTTTPTGGTKTTVSRFGVDSGASGEPYDVTETTPLSGAKTETERSFAGDKTITDNSGNTLSGYHEAQDHFLKRSGNIGVKTAAEMLLTELNLRKINLLQEYIHIFFSRHGFAVGGDDE